MGFSLSKENLEQNFSDHPSHWVSQAKGFRYSAVKLKESFGLEFENKKIFTSEEVFNIHFLFNCSCYFLANAIELLLKAIYCADEKLTKERAVTKFSHDIKELREVLIKEQLIRADQVPEKIFELASLLLSWLGRYHSPKKKEIDETINKFFKKLPDGKFMRNQDFRLDDVAYKKLIELVDTLFEVAPKGYSDGEYLFKILI